MMTFEKVLEVFNDYLNKDSVLEVVNTKRGYTVMIWDEKDEQWFGVEHCKAPELLRDALLDGYRDFLEQQLTHNRRSLTETEILDIQNESVRNLVSLEAHASLDKTSICRNLLLILGIFCCRIFLLLLV